MKHRNLWLVALLMFGIASPALATPFDMGTTLQQYQTASTQFASSIGTAAKWLAITLGTIDLSLLVLQKLIRSEGPQEIMVAVLMRTMWYGFLMFLMNANVMTAVINGFLQLGKTASGISVFNPADVFWQGIDLVNMMTSAFADNANIAGVPVPAGLAAAANPMVAFMLGLTIILIVISFLILTAQYAVILVQMYFYLACYPIVVAMGGIKAGREMTTKAISGAIVIGVRFLAIYFVLYAAQQMATTMGQQLANFSIADMSPMWSVFGMSGLLAFLALKVPQMAADLLGGTASLSGGDAVAAGAVAGGAAGAVAGTLASAAGGVANGVAGAVRAGQSAIAQARERGASGIDSTAAGAAGAVGGAMGEATMEKIKGLGSESAGGRLAERIDSRTASIREANAARSTSAQSVPGGQPPAPTGSSSPTSPDTATSAGGAQDASDATRPTPAVPGAADAAEASAATTAVSPPSAAADTIAPSGTGQASASSAPAQPDLPTGSGIDTGDNIGKAIADRDAGRNVPPPMSETPPPPPPPDSATSSSTDGSATAPTAAQKLAGNLVNELKQADQVQGASVTIQAGGHE